MKHNKQELDAIIDDVTRRIRDEQVDPSVVDKVSNRIWARVSQEAAGASVNSHLEHLHTMNAKNTTEQIRGCDDFQSLIPPYLDGKLSAARTLLLEDHSKECIPCRLELKAQRTGATVNAAVARPAAAKAHWWNNFNTLRWGFAAAFAVCVGIAGLFAYERLDLSGRTLAATLENADGSVYVVSDQQIRPLAAGEQLQKGERVRTAKDSNAVLRLADGSTVEMRERSEFSVSENMRGVTIKLDRGDVVVEAAKQHNGRLYVQTPDSLVSVKGTIFAVESGIKGSRVSVVEGEVKVDHAGKQDTLLPGDQTTTNTSLDKAPVKKTVAWSRNAARYAELVSQLAKLRHDIDTQVPRPGVRYSSKLVDLVPENSVFYAALPNLSETLARSQRIMQERIKQNPALAEWWKGDRGGDGPGINEQTLARVQEFGSQLGDEIVVSAALDAKGEPSGILVLGEVKDGASFRTYLDGQLARFANGTGDMPNIRIIDDPMTFTASVTPRSAAKTPQVKDKVTGKKDEVFVWVNNDIFAASPQIESLRGLSTRLKTPDANRFANSSFHQRINDVYADGAGLLIAADLEKIVGQAIAKDTSPEAARHIQGLKQLGVMNLRHFIVEQKEVDGKTLSRAALTFSESNKGIASWLAAPGPMGALDYISPNANVATASS
ncbi:MAG: FecR domain-containing protein [Acidobacteriota bacterium]